jgi:hypothetical protein
MTPILYVGISVLFECRSRGLFYPQVHEYVVLNVYAVRAIVFTQNPSPTIRLCRMMSSHMFDNTGRQYNVSRILTPQSTLDEEAYKQYSPLFLSFVVVTFSFSHEFIECSASFAMAYGLSFATITATLVHSALYFRKQIRLQIGRSLSEQPDVHARLMARYPQGSLAYNGTPRSSLTFSSS